MLFLVWSAAKQQATSTEQHFKRSPRRLSLLSRRQKISSLPLALFRLDPRNTTATPRDAERFVRHHGERKGCVDAKWGVSDTTRRAKIYSITRDGRKQLQTDVAERIATHTSGSEHHLDVKDSDVEAECFDRLKCDFSGQLCVCDDVEEGVIGADGAAAFCLPRRRTHWVATLNNTRPTVRPRGRGL